MTGPWRRSGLQCSNIHAGPSIELARIVHSPHLGSFENQPLCVLSPSDGTKIGPVAINDSAQVRISRRMAADECGYFLVAPRLQRPRRTCSWGKHASVIKRPQLLGTQGVHSSIRMAKEKTAAQLLIGRVPSPPRFFPHTCSQKWTIQLAAKRKINGILLIFWVEFRARFPNFITTWLHRW